jgi:hypothetical protein
VALAGDLFTILMRIETMDRWTRELRRARRERERERARRRRNRHIEGHEVVLIVSCVVMFAMSCLLGTALYLERSNRDVAPVYTSVDMKQMHDLVWRGVIPSSKQVY